MQQMDPLHIKVLYFKCNLDLKKQEPLPFKIMYTNLNNRVFIILKGEVH